MERSIKDHKERREIKVIEDIKGRLVIRERKVIKVREVCRVEMDL